MLRCGLGITENARKGMAQIVTGEHAFFALQDAFDIYIEKRPNNKQGNMSFSFFFDNETNEVLAKRLQGKVVVMECVYQHDGFLATGFHVRGRKEVVRTNRRLPTRLKFQLGRNTGATMPVDLYTSLRELPIAEERSDYVKKRISSWEGYLRIQERNADVADVTSVFSRASFSEDFSKLRLLCNDLNGPDWQAIKGFSAKMAGTSQDIGSVLNANRSKSLVEIELNRHYRELARQHKWQPQSFKEVTFSNFLELSQVRRLRKGFKDLQDGLAANANLEKVLFEERPTVRIAKQQQQLEFHNELNKFQREAVTGAMTSHDLYVIQGPPGTGKTTVISEICHQNVKAGLRTLVASQANLAVDNALGRLLSHQDIRILRYGRTESIEEEGKKFIEENVALNWKNQTLAAVNEQLRAHSEREAQLIEDIEHGEVEQAELQKQLVALSEKIRVKQVAEVEQLTLTDQINEQATRTDVITTEREGLLQRQSTLQTLSDEVATEIGRLELHLQSQRSGMQSTEQIDKLQQRLVKLRGDIDYRQTVQKIDETEQSLAVAQQELAVKRQKIDDLQHLVNELEGVMELDLLEKRLAEAGGSLPSGTKPKITDLNRLLGDIAASQSIDGYAEWTELAARLATAIQMLEELLREHGFLKHSGEKTVRRSYTTVAEINGLVDNIARFLVASTTKQSLAIKSYSAEKYENLEKIAIALHMLRHQKSFTAMQLAGFEKQNGLLSQSKTLFTAIRQEVIYSLQQTVETTEQNSVVIRQQCDTLQLELTNLRQTSLKLLEQLGTVDETTMLSDMTAQLADIEQVYAAYQQTKASLETIESELKQQLTVARLTTEEQASNASALQALAEEQLSLGEKIVALQQRLAVLADILMEQPEVEQRQVVAILEALQEELKDLTKEQRRLPITQTLQRQWLSLLTEANDYDLDEIRKLYVKHANVIGTTCVASARRDFMEEYPTFDVVIIDEVSKATPPELLLPMLKGKKIILVGDHHQLPPLVGQETLEEFLEEIDVQEDKKEFEKLLNESLFERLFRTLPKQNKTMLGIQYRMHESIMQTITPFYEEGDYRLQCGLTDSDTVRDHMIDSPYIKRKDHLLWFDMPNKPAYFEEKVKGGTSRFNEAELTMVKNLLVDLEQATAKVKNEGKMKPEDKKSVGVISFYGEQVKRIDRLIQQELVPQHLHCRTGSVDKFQGMEMDIIILSFVRNHGEKGGDIGFARDYRRLNVALSRARELLIIIGSSEMFTVRTKHPGSREMYGRLLEDIQKNNGFKPYKEI